MRKAEVTKKAIIDATIRLLRQNSSVTIHEISAEAGVNIAAVNYHFVDKQSLLEIVIRRLIGELKANIDSFLVEKPTTPAEIRDDIRKFVESFYEFAFTNIGVIRYLLVPANKKLLSVCYKNFVSLFSLDSEFMYKIIDGMSAFGVTSSQSDLKAKYMLLFSSLMMPLLFSLDLSELSVRGRDLTPGPEIREKYIDHLANIILQ